MAMNCFHLEIGFIYSVPQHLLAWLYDRHCVRQWVDEEVNEGPIYALKKLTFQPMGSHWPKAVSISPSQVLPASKVPGEGSWTLKEVLQIEGSRFITDQMSIIRGIMEKYHLKLKGILVYLPKSE